MSYEMKSDVLGEAGSCTLVCMTVGEPFDSIKSLHMQIQYQHMISRRL